MDALEFARSKRRMCDMYYTEQYGCSECPLESHDTCAIGDNDFTWREDIRIIEAVEKWSAEHPLRTRQDTFLDMFPNAKLDERGVLIISPCVVDRSYGVEKNKANCCIGKTCGECRPEFWLTPLEDE